jgi:chromosome segregation ATPase
METLFAEKDHIEKELSSLRQLNEELQTLVVERDTQISEHEGKVSQMQEALDRSAKQVKNLKIQFQNKLKTMRESQSHVAEQVRSANNIKKIL